MRSHPTWQQRRGGYLEPSSLQSRGFGGRIVAPTPGWSSWYDRPKCEQSDTEGRLRYAHRFVAWPFHTGY